MTKEKFLSELGARLSRLPKREIEECLAFYGEMIEDRIEEGLSEQEAVLAVGDVDKIAKEKLGDEISEKLSVEDKKSSGKYNGGKLALIIAGSPLWISLFAAAFAVVVSLYASAWAVIVSLWSAFGAFAVSAPAGLILGIVMFSLGRGLLGAVLISTAFIAFSLAIFSFYACIWLTKKSVILTKTTFNYIVKYLSGKENSNEKN